MLSNKKLFLIIAVIAICLALVVALKTISIGEKSTSPRGVLVGRTDNYGC